MSRPKRKRRPANQVDAVLDLETSQWDQFVLGALKTRGGRMLLRDHTREEDFFRRLLAFDGVVWTFNGGRFDTIAVAEWCARLGRPAVLRGSGQRIVSLECGQLEIRDVAALMPFMSLDEAAKIAGRRKSETTLECRCDGNRHCGGYCSITRDLSRAQMAGLANYLEDDCDLTLAILDRLFSYGESVGIEWAITIGASAWKTAVAWSGLPDARWHPREYETLRDGYKGGRTQVIAPLAESGERYDINSSYPHQLRKLDLPCGDRFYPGPTEAASHYARGLDGVYDVEVSIPADTFLPSLPYRLADRIAFPTGTMWGRWTGLELRYAESHGATIESFRGGITFAERAPLLRDFCTRVWDLRAKARQENDPIQKFLKSFANSLTGKFAQKPELETLKIIPDGRGRPCPGKGKCRDTCSRRCGAQHPVGRSQVVFSEPSYRLSPNGHIHWAAHLTAAARIQLHEQLTDDGQGGRTAVYCDTDSVYSRAPRSKDIGADLGQWKHEGSFREWRALAPKTYSYYDPQTGEFKAASKGIPEAERNFDALVSGLSVAIDRGVEGIRTAARRDGGSLFHRKQAFRRVLADGLHFGDRILHTDGLTYPQDAAILQE